jgi:two-component system sensor histidine kinase PilS (NtrC family)
MKELVTVFENDRALDGARVELDAPGPVWIEADAGQLRQVVWNLVRNACQASPPGAPVVIGVGTVVEAGQRWARLAVRDRGPGIPVENQARIFEPFFSTKQGGTGLGLATVHRIIEEHKGRLQVSSPSDGGAEFEVRLPLAQ